MGRHPLQHDGRSFAIAHAWRNPDQAVGRDSDELGIGAHDAGPGHVVAGFHRLDLRAHRRDHAGAFLADYEGQRDRISALAMVNVNEIDARSGDLHHGFVGFGLRNRNLHQFEGFRAAGLFYLDGFHVRLD